VTEQPTASAAEAPAERAQEQEATARTREETRRPITYILLDILMGVLIVTLIWLLFTSIYCFVNPNSPRCPK
jgi:hypothetical protein